MFLRNSCWFNLFVSLEREINFYSHIKSKMLYNEDSSLGTQQFPVFCLCPSLPFSLSAPLLFLLSFYWLSYYHSCIAACHFAQITAVSPVDGGTLPDWYSVPGTVPSTLPNSGSLSQHFLLSHGFNDDTTGQIWHVSCSSTTLEVYDGKQSKT